MSDDKSTDNSLFQHLLDYQDTEEFKAEEAGNRNKERLHRRPSIRNSQKRYRAKYPQASHLRSEAAKRKTALAQQQGWLCRWCGEPLNDDIELDHIIPISKGGNNKPHNLCVCHAKCNRKKADRIVLD